MDNPDMEMTTQINTNNKIDKYDNTSNDNFEYIFLIKELIKTNFIEKTAVLLFILMKCFQII